MHDLPAHLAEHFEDPFHFGTAERYTHAAELAYDECPEGSDLLVMQLLVDADEGLVADSLGGAVREIWFDGEACCWCQAAASLVAERLTGQLIVDVLRFCQPDDSKEPRDLRLDIERQFEAVPSSRHGCVDLVKQAILAALQADEDDPDRPTMGGPNLGEEQ